MENIGRLADEGKLVLAGPFFDDGELRGIYIFDVQSIEDAEDLMATDPAIQSGSLVMKLHTCCGSAAVRQINEIHQQIAKINI
ncbi:MAG: YciI family protein [Flavobacteriales bacterium]|nr:YciI family protein [Flavobacteriales bacterium]